ncbi:hypothetical protein J921_2594 [Acinetobacter baumannii 25493_8]|nr:hypothetical protein ACIN5110_2675 [Acinetobacter baumannii OIFC110]EKP68458.1 hypothetical protein ACIN5035_1172 [Acinetobacter baumannii OIFC035]ELX06933.1 hypothetical protein ACINNAV57_1151 [Acinetobacter baumannii Naval-57]ETQ98458.1 hypothetical protein P673_3488 [Acinetobacter baumannii UH6507]EXA55358.1 hypothetical protein J505_3544 [Acinetobacter baumannii 1297549]EXA62452.1 hypothetical protein J521_0729 [Acinetobacter baumannii 1035119]EXA74787.1 hypothetical protein J517_4506 
MHLNSVGRKIFLDTYTEEENGIIPNEIKLSHDNRDLALKNNFN